MRAGSPTPKKADRVMVVPLARANNVSIMLTQFKDSPQGIRRAVVTGKGLSLERLSLLLQVSCSLPALQSCLNLLDRSIAAHFSCVIICCCTYHDSVCSAHTANSCMFYYVVWSCLITVKWFVRAELMPWFADCSQGG